MNNLESSTLTRIKNAHINLCRCCQYTYPECPSDAQDVLFGNFDNVCSCAKFKPLVTGDWVDPHGEDRPEKGDLQYVYVGGVFDDGRVIKAFLREDDEWTIDNHSALSVRKWLKLDTPKYSKYICEDIVRCPVKEVFEGEWTFDSLAGDWICSKCDLHSMEHGRYCPNCGAKMRIEI